MKYGLNVAIQNLFTHLGEASAIDDAASIDEAFDKIVDSEYKEQLLDAVERAGYLIEKQE